MAQAACRAFGAGCRVRVLPGRQFQDFGAGDRGVVLRVDAAAGACDVAFGSASGAEASSVLRVAARHLELDLSPGAGTPAPASDSADSAEEGPVAPARGGDQGLRPGGVEEPAAALPGPPRSLAELVDATQAAGAWSRAPPGALDGALGEQPVGAAGGPGGAAGNAEGAAAGRPCGADRLAARLAALEELSDAQHDAQHRQERRAEELSQRFAALEALSDAHRVAQERRAEGLSQQLERQLAAAACGAGELESCQAALSALRDRVDALCTQTDQQLQGLQRHVDEFSRVVADGVSGQEALHWQLEARSQEQTARLEEVARAQANLGELCAGAVELSKALEGRVGTLWETLAEGAALGPRLEKLESAVGEQAQEVARARAADGGLLDGVRGRVQTLEGSVRDGASACAALERRLDALEAAAEDGAPQAEAVEALAQRVEELGRGQARCSSGQGQLAAEVGALADQVGALREQLQALAADERQTSEGLSHRLPALEARVVLAEEAGRGAARAAERAAEGLARGEAPSEQLRELSSRLDGLSRAGQLGQAAWEQGLEKVAELAACAESQAQELRRLHDQTAGCHRWEQELRALDSLVASGFGRMEERVESSGERVASIQADFGRASAELQRLRDEMGWCVAARETLARVEHLANEALRMGQQAVVETRQAASQNEEASTEIRACVEVLTEGLATEAHCREEAARSMEAKYIRLQELVADRESRSAQDVLSSRATRAIAEQQMEAVMSRIELCEEQIQGSAQREQTRLKNFRDFAGALGDVRSEVEELRADLSRQGQRPALNGSLSETVKPQAMWLQRVHVTSGTEPDADARLEPPRDQWAAHAHPAAVHQSAITPLQHHRAPARACAAQPQWPDRSSGVTVYPLGRAAAAPLPLEAPPAAAALDAAASGALGGFLDRAGAAQRQPQLDPVVAGGSPPRQRMAVPIERVASAPALGRAAAPGPAPADRSLSPEGIRLQGRGATQPAVAWEARVFAPPRGIIARAPAAAAAP